VGRDDFFCGVFISSQNFSEHMRISFGEYFRHMRDRLSAVESTANTAINLHCKTQHSESQCQWLAESKSIEQCSLISAASLNEILLSIMQLDAGLTRLRGLEV
jgi:predicted ATP-dependent Lon-type protease